MKNAKRLVVIKVLVVIVLQGFIAFVFTRRIGYYALQEKWEWVVLYLFALFATFFLSGSELNRYLKGSKRKKTDIE